MEENVIIDFLACHDLRPLKDNVEQREEHHYVVGLKDEIQRNGPHALFTRYSPLVKLLERSSQTKSVVTTTILDILDITWSYLDREFKQVNGNFQDEDPAHVVELRKILAMVLFLTYRAILDIENFRFGEGQQKFLRTVGSTGKRKGTPTSHFPYWEDYRQKLLNNCRTIITYDLNSFWGSHEVESGSGFLRCVLLFCMIILRQGSRDVVRDPDLSQVVYALLGVLSTKYGEEESVLTRLIPIVKEGEDAAKAVTGALVTLTNDFGRDMVIFVAVNKVLELYSENLTKESAADKSLGIFLQEISHVNPKAIVKCLSLVLEFLEAEAYAVRNSVLSLCSELLIWSKQNPDDPDAQVKTRGQLVRILLDHLLDGNAYVRSKVIQLMTRLIKDDHLYTFEKLNLMEELQKRVFDKTPTARKFAIAFFVEMIKKNPPLIKFNPDEWRFKVRETKNHLIHLLIKDLPSPDLEIKVAVSEFLSQVVDKGIAIPEIPLEKPQDAVEKIKELLEQKIYWEACEYMHNAIEQFQDDQTFQLLLAFNQFEIYVRFFKNLLNLEIESEEKPLEEGDFAESKSATEHREFEEYCELCQGMSKVYYNLIPKMARLLDSGSENDRAEVIAFYAQLVECNYEPDEVMMTSVLESIKNIDGKTMTSQIDSFCIIFFRGTETNHHGMVKKLIELANSADLLQRRSISFIIRELMNADKLNLETCATILWDAFFLTIPGWTSEHSRGALFILGILGRQEKSVISSNLSILIEEAFGPRGYEDLPLMKAACEAIYMTCQKPVDKNKLEERERYEPKHILFEKLTSIIIHGLDRSTEISDDGYVKVVEICIRMIYGLCVEPSDIITPLVKDIAGTVFPKRSRNGEAVEVRLESGVEDLKDVADQCSTTEANINSQPETAREKSKASRKTNGFGTGEIKMSESLLYRYVSVIRFLFGAHMNFYDKLVTHELKRRKVVVEAYNRNNKSSKRKKPTDNARGSKNDKRTRGRKTLEALKNLVTNTRNSLNASVRDDISRHISDASALTTPAGNRKSNSALDELMASKDVDKLLSKLTASSLIDPDSEIQEMLGSSAFDEEMDMLHGYMSKICDSGCFQMYRTQVLYLCRRINEFNYTKLKAAIINCLGKIMSVKPKAVADCEQVFLDAWKYSDCSAVKCELVRSSILLNVRFPSHVEKINACILSGLTDSETVVRMATLDSIIYLTLKDLMKTRDQLADASVCLLDSSPEIREMVKDFFSKCNEKGNTIQNALPEILSRLIKRDDVDQVQLQDIMKHLLGYIKEKRVGGLVDKIANLYQKVQDVRFAQDLAFCLKQFTYNEKTIKCIIDHFPHYQDKLVDDFVFEAFENILENARKNCKPEYKVKLDDYEKELNNAREQCLKHQRVLNNVNRKDSTELHNSSSSASSASDLSDNDEEDFDRVARVRPKTTAKTTAVVDNEKENNNEDLTSEQEENDENSQNSEVD